MRKTLGVARSNVSNSLKELQNWNLIRVVHAMGDRRDHFETSTDVWELFRIVVQQRKEREFDPAIAVLRECLDSSDISKEDKAARSLRVELEDFAMNILICGASGFVGRHLYEGLSAAGHHCVRGVRRPQSAQDIQIDYLHNLKPEQWLPLLKDIDVVINAVGVLRDTRAQPMQQLLTEAPTALFRACAQAHVKRIINLSALGIDSALTLPYFQRRREAEAVLFASPPSLRWLNLRPSAIYGEGGASARMFRVLASLPLHGLPLGGKQQLQPVHVSDLVAAVRNWLADDNAPSLCVNAAGAEVVTLRGMLDSYREQLGYKPALHLPVPGFAVKLGAWFGDFLPFSPLCTDTLTMLNAGNTGDNASFTRLLGRAPLHYSCFITKESAQ